MSLNFCVSTFKIPPIQNPKISVLLESAKLRAVGAHVTTCLACLRVHVLTCLACLRAHVTMCFTYTRANVSCVSTCSRTNMPCVFCVPTCSGAITTNDKDKFSITCFPYILWLFFVFFLWNKTVLDSCISLSSQKSLTGAMTNFAKWNRLIFVWA